MISSKESEISGKLQDSISLEGKLELIKCPYCGSVRVYRSSSFFIHALRTLSDSNKRYCAACKKRWQSRYGRNFKLSIYTFILAGVLFAGAFFLLKFADEQNAFKKTMDQRRSAGAGEGSKKQDPNEDIQDNYVLANQIQNRAQKIWKLQKQYLSS